MLAPCQRCTPNAVTMHADHSSGYTVKLCDTSTGDRNIAFVHLSARSYAFEAAVTAARCHLFVSTSN